MNLIRKAVRKYETGGWQGVVKSVANRYSYWAEHKRRNSPVPWARWGRASFNLSRVISTSEPAILVLSLPGSGSSWVGETLGNASNAVYLRESLTQSNMALGAGEAVFDIDPNNPPLDYERFAEYSFNGFPAFSPQIVKYPKQWSLLRRPFRRLVIKEVNPLACDWLLQRYRPRVIFLIRHPAAVAARSRRLGFWPRSGSNIWKDQGEFQGEALSAQLECLSNYPDHQIILYEELCATPMECFSNLFEFADLVWDRKIEQFIEANTTEGDRRDPWGTSRDSQRMIWAWKGQLADEELEQLRIGYERFDLPWYKSLDDWRN